MSRVTGDALRDERRASGVMRRSREEIMGHAIRREDALVLAHYYVPDAVQAAADFVGDSFALAQKAVASDKPVIVFCGVSFMGESAKILCPEKEVYLPVPSAHCAMADMASEEEIVHMRENVEDLAVVTYVNSSARLKALSDVIVTSSNAVKVVSRLKEKNIYFIPDKNLGHYVAAQLPEKKFYFGRGACPIHNATSEEEIAAARSAHPGALLLVHPECPAAVCAQAAYVGSTAGIIAYAEKSEAQEFLIGTEEGTLYELSRRCPGKKFYPTRPDFVCADMKKITPEALERVFAGKGTPVEVAPDVAEKAARALRRMLELAQ